MEKLNIWVIFAGVFFIWTRNCGAEHCQCMSYLISEDGLSKENQVNSMELTIYDINCDGDGIERCKDECIETYEEMTDKGRTCVIMPGSELLVADWMCQALKRNVDNAHIGVFVQGCGSDPVDTGFRFHETLSCKSGQSILC